MFDEAVAAGVAAFMIGDDPPTDEAVGAWLRQTGVEPWLAARLVVLLPLAFGRRVIGGARLSDSFLDGPSERRLVDEPVFLAATARAEQASRAEVERIGLRSSEFNAVNNALHGGSRLEDLVCGPPALATPLPPAVEGDGGVPSPRAAFAAFLAGHGFPGGLEVDARVFGRSGAGSAYVLVQVDFAVRHPGLAMPWLVESFAGAGSTWREAVNESIVKFEQASLHPIIAALLDRGACQDQVSWEPYAHRTGRFDLCLGPQLTLYTAEAPPPVRPLLDKLLWALRDEPLSYAIHSLRLFTSYQDGALQTVEVLLDGVNWADGEAIVAAAPPPAAAARAIGTRVFGLLVPAN